MKNNLKTFKTNPDTLSQLSKVHRGLTVKFGGMRWRVMRADQERDGVCFLLLNSITRELCFLKIIGSSILHYLPSSDENKLHAAKIITQSGIDGVNDKNSIKHLFSIREKKYALNSEINGRA